ncbi:hypothetical protein KRMM14A1259_71880 [Krasilnikovia sp. MM14-A1259]
MDVGRQRVARVRAASHHRHDRFRVQPVLRNPVGVKQRHDVSVTATEVDVISEHLAITHHIGTIPARGASQMRE